MNSRNPYHASPNYYYDLGLYETHLMVYAKAYSNQIYNQESWMHHTADPRYDMMKRLMRLTSE